jgi:serine protease AprX
MVELQFPGRVLDDITARAVQSRASRNYAFKSAQDLGFSGSGVRIAFLDTGIRETHEQLTGKYVAGFDALDPMDNADGSTHPPDVNGHGTGVATVALGKGVTSRVCRTPDDGSVGANCGGVAPLAQFVNVKICDASGACPAILEGLEWVRTNAVRFGIRIINLSVGCYGNDEDGTSAIAQEVDYLVSTGLVVVAALGNASSCSPSNGPPYPDGTRLVPAPASSTLAITVNASSDEGSINRSDDKFARDYLKGPRKATPLSLADLKPELTAPADGVKTADFTADSSYLFLHGSSIAAAHVSGAAALVLEARPGIDPSSVKRLLMDSADSTLNAPAAPLLDRNWDAVYGAGFLLRIQ